MYPTVSLSVIFSQKQLPVAAGNKAEEIKVWSGDNSLWDSHTLVPLLINAALSCMQLSK